VHGLDRDHGIDGFKRYVALAVRETFTALVRLCGSKTCSEKSEKATMPKGTSHPSSRRSKRAPASGFAIRI
jgi:hypothetical protein